jgi:tRNA A-37 threonylcarbamoyl transferase component Bud32
VLLQFDKEEVIDALKFLKKKAGIADFRVKWVYDFFLGDYCMTRENALAGALPPAATPPDPAKDRAKQYVNKMKASQDNGDDEDKNQDDNDGMDPNEDAEEIDVKTGGAGSSKVTLKDFDLIRVLGRGAFGKVVQVRKKDTGELYAMKILKKAMVYKRKQLAHTLAERRILEAAAHPFCVSLKFAFQNEGKLYFVMDFCTGGELYYHLKKQKNKRFSESAAKVMGAEIALGLGHLHKNRFIYRDLKPENVLLHGDGHALLSDFGLAKELDPEANDTRTMCGTPEYLGKFSHSILSL